MKTKIVLSFLVANFILVAYLMISAKSREAIASSTSSNTEQQVVKNESVAVVTAASAPMVVKHEEPAAAPIKVSQIPSPEKICYTFTTNELNSDISSIANATQTKIKEDKKYNIYWGLSNNKDEAVAKYKELQAKIFDGKSMDLIYISQQYSLLVGKADKDTDALAQVRSMSEKTASMGGHWFYGSYTIPTYQIKFAALANDTNVAKLQKVYPLSRCTAI